MSAAVPGRLVCSRCGANNFDTQAACWKCGAALAVGSAVPTASAPPTGARLSPSIGSAAPSAHAPVAMEAAAYRPTSIDPAVAVWAAFALAFFFPFTAVPVGVVFLMLDDRRKAEIGRIALMWGVIFSLLHILWAFWAVQGTVRETVRLIQTFGGRAGGSAQPKLTDPVTFPTP